MSSFHDKLVGIIAELCEEYKTRSGKEYYSKIFADHLAELEYRPLSVTRTRRGKKALVESYYADVWAKRKNRMLHVFEVWDTQNIDAAVADIFFASLVKNIEYLHIVCTGNNITEDKAQDLVDLFLPSVRNKHGESLLPSNNIYILQIPDEIDRRRPNEIKKYLRKKWFP